MNWWLLILGIGFVANSVYLIFRPGRPMVDLGAPAFMDRRITAYDAKVRDILWAGIGILCGVVFVIWSFNPPGDFSYHGLQWRYP